MKKLIAAVMAVFLFLFSMPALASTDEVRTFGFTDERHRDAGVDITLFDFQGKRRCKKWAWYKAYHPWARDEPRLVMRVLLSYSVCLSYIAAD